MSPCTACQPRPIPLSSPLPVRWARAASDLRAQLARAAAPLAARVADRSLNALRRWLMQGRVVHLRPDAGWDGRFSLPEDRAEASSQPVASAPASAPRRDAAAPLQPQDWAALDDRLLRDIGLSDWLRASAAAQREADRALDGSGRMGADESTTRIARSGW